MASRVVSARKISLLANIETDKVLNRFKELGMSYTETLRHALKLYSYIADMQAAGNRIYVQSLDGDTHELRII